MSRLCRLKTRSHGEDGQWAYSEIVRLRAENERIRALGQLHYDQNLALQQELAAVKADNDVLRGRVALAEVERGPFVQ